MKIRFIVLLAFFGLGLALGLLGVKRLQEPFTRSPLTNILSPSTPAPTPTKSWKELEAAYPEIAEYFRLYAAKAAMPSEDATSQLETIISARPQSPAAYEAHLVLAHHWAQKMDPRAEDSFRAALRLEDSPEVRLRLATYLEGLGKQEEAYAEYQVLLRHRPEAVEGLKRNAPDRLGLAQDLILGRYYEEALGVLEASGAPEVLRLPLKVQAQRLLSQWQEALGAARQWLSLEPQNESAVMATADVLNALGNTAEALKLYQRVDSVGSRLAQARLLEETQPLQALALFRDLAFPSGWWETAGVLERLGRPGEAISFYLKVAQTDSPLWDDAAYRAYVLAGRTKDAATQKQAADILAQVPVNYFCLRLNKGEGTLNANLDPLAEASPLLEKVRALDTLGWTELAQRELVYGVKFSPDITSFAALGQTLYRRGQTLEIQPLAESRLTGLKEAPLTIWRLAYPLAYLAEVQGAANEFNVDPLLILAVMREESRYKPFAVSRSNAQGLMQLMPATRDWIASKLGLSVGSTAVFDPKTNIRLGAWYLSYLLRFFDGDVELALAAYNGGPGNVDKWQKLPLVKDRDDLLRFIPYYETREYIQWVMSGYFVYRELARLEGVSADRR